MAAKGAVKQQARMALEHTVKPQAARVRRSLCSWRFLVNSVKTFVLIIFFYCFSITLTFYNQRLMSVVRFPLSITLVHLVVKFMLSCVVRFIVECKTGKPRVVLPWKLYILKIFPPGLFSALDIGLSNWSFEFITVSLYTMTKSTVVVFILGFSILLKLEKPKYSLIGVVMLIAAGLFMFTYQSTQFVLNGFLLCMGASFLSGLRWTTSQLVLQKAELGLSNPLDMMYHIQPWMVLGLLPLSAAFEATRLATNERTFGFHDWPLMLETSGIVLGGALLAFMLELSEFLLVSQTSCLTLSIAGIFKEICTLYLAVKINGDHMNTMNMCGLLVCLAGIALHVIIKAVNMKEESSREVFDQSIEMLLKNGHANTDTEDEDEIELFNVKNDR